MSARHSRQTLCTSLAFGIAFLELASAQPLANDDHTDGPAGSSLLASPLAKRADIDDTAAILIGGDTPQGPIVLVFGALGVAFVCLVFAIIKANISSSKRITEERLKAKTDLRLKGGQTSRRGSRTMLSSGAQSPASTPLVSRADLGEGSSSDSTVAAGKRMSTGRPFSQHVPRGYSGSSASRNSGLKSNFTSFSGSSLAEVPMLSATGRMATMMSTYSTSSGEPSSQQNTPGNGPRTVAGPRPPMRHAPSGHRHSTSTVFRGTNLYLARASSGATPYVNPSAVDRAYSPRSSSPKLITGSSELRRHASESVEHSRRNSAAGLLEDDPFSPLSPYQSAPSSAEHSSSALSPTNVHPLTNASANRSQAAGAHSTTSSASVSSGAPSHPSTHAPSYPTSTDARASTLRPGVAPAGPRANRNAGFFQFGGGADSRDAEQGEELEHLRPGQLAQPITEGNGRRGRRGQPVGGAPSYI